MCSLSTDGLEEYSWVSRHSFTKSLRTPAPSTARHWGMYGSAQHDHAIVLSNCYKLRSYQYFLSVPQPVFVRSLVILACLFVSFLCHPMKRVRGDYASYPIEVITELPRIKQTRVGGGGGGVGGGGGGRRRRPYGDTGITMVDEGYLPSASAFREAGNRSLFRFERRSNYGENDNDDHADAIVEATLRSVKERNNRAASAARNSAAAATAAAEKDFTFLTGVERQEGEFDAGADPAAAAGEEGAGFGTAVAADIGGVLGQQTGGAGGMSTRLLRGPVDPMVRGDPVKLQMALAALRYTLKHPVTSSMDTQRNRPQQQGGLASGKSKDGRESGVGRKTAASRARQLPRRPFRLLKPPHEPGFCVGLLDGPAKGGGVAGRLSRVDKVCHPGVYTCPVPGSFSYFLPL